MQEEYQTVSQVIERLSELSRLYGPDTPIQICGESGAEFVSKIWTEPIQRTRQEVILIFGENAL